MSHSLSHLSRTEKKLLHPSLTYFIPTLPKELGILLKMKNVDLEQKYFTLQQENSTLHSQNESLRSAANSETCSLLSGSEYAALHRVDSPSPNSPPHIPTNTNGHVVDWHSMTDELARMREELGRLMAEKQGVEEAVRRREEECTALHHQLGKAVGNILKPSTVPRCPTKVRYLPGRYRY